MKKRIIIIILLIFLVGCSKNTLSLDRFKEMAQYNGYILNEDKSGYTAYPDILNVYYAINRENAYDIQFLELKNDDYAHKFFLYNMNDLKENISSEDYQKYKSTSNYDLYHAETLSEYLLVLRSGVSIIYINAPINYINEIEEFLHDLDLEY